MEVGIRDSPFEVEPDPRIFCAVEGTAGQGALRVDSTAPRPAVEVDAIAVSNMGDDKGFLAIPLDDAFFQILFGQCEGKSAAGCTTKMDTVFAIDRHAIAERVLIGAVPLKPDLSLLFSAGSVVQNLYGAANRFGQGIQTVLCSASAQVG